MKSERELQDEILRLRSLLYHSVVKNHELSPSGCTPCDEINKEVGKYLTGGK